MRTIHYKVRGWIFKVLDIFYPIFRRFMPLQTYHYAACGGTNTLLTLFTYSFSFHFIFKEKLVHLGPLTFEPYVASLFVAFLVSFPVGFYFSMYVIFQGSYLKKRVQLFRYFIVIMFCMLINYVCLKIFVGYFKWYPTPSQILTTGIVILVNYFSQRYFSFRSGKSLGQKASA